MTVDELYERGFMNTNMYYQLNGKSLDENYRDFKNKQSKKFFDEIKIRAELYDVVETALDDILKQFPDFK